MLIDSEQLESGKALDRNFRAAAADEIERFRRETVLRTGNRLQAERLSDEDLLREAMNTVGKVGRLGGETRCVVSVSMLTEGWDANTVTHILGVRAFGTQLLCEQVVGRALRRQSYDLGDDGLLPVEYADVLGVPFDFTSEPVVGTPMPPRKVTQVHAVSPERDACEICFPRVSGYRVELPEDRLEAKFDDQSTLELTPELVGPSKTRNAGILGEGVELDLLHTQKLRDSTLVFHLTKRLLETKWRDPDKEPKYHLFGQLKRIAREWLDNHLICKGGTFPAQLMYHEIADIACERIFRGIFDGSREERPILAMLDPYNPTGSTRHVNFVTSRPSLWKTDSRLCHISHVVCDSTWEAEFCRVAEAHPHVHAYVKNHGLGFEVPYKFCGEARTYLPDFILRLDNRRNENKLLYLVVEIKGYRNECAKEKRATMETYWIPSVNALKTFGCWEFAEFTDIHEIEAEFDAVVKGIVPEVAAKTWAM